MIISVIGTGNMGKALAMGFTSRFEGNIELKLFDVYEPSLKAAVESIGGTACGSIEECVKDADYVLMAVKPINFDEALTDVAKYLKS